mgnify:CR=1
RARRVNWVERNLVQSVGGARTYARKAPNAALLNHHDRPFVVLSSFGIQLEGQKRLKGAVIDAQIAAGAVVLNDSNHGLTHENPSVRLAITLCPRKSLLTDVMVVKFLGASQQPQSGADANDTR